MYEISNFLRNTKRLPLCIIKFPSGRYGYVGSVPVDIAYADGATEKEISDAAKFGARFGPKRRTFSSSEEAVTFAEARGYKVQF